MTELRDAIARLRALNEPVPTPMRLPGNSELETLERQTGVTFPPDLRQYLLEASDIVLGTLEPITVTDTDNHTYFPTVLEDARDASVPDTLIPFCEDNGDYFCLDASGIVRFWSHDGPTDESWPSLAAWIEQVWIEENG